MEYPIPSAKYINQLIIKGLWNRFDVNWTLNPDVNILVGENGTGKSTILNLIANDFKRKKNEYDSKIQVAKTVLALNSNYEDCFLFEKIITDIRTSFSVS